MYRSLLLDIETDSACHTHIYIFSPFPERIHLETLPRMGAVDVHYHDSYWRLGPGNSNWTRMTRSMNERMSPESYTHALPKLSYEQKLAIMRRRAPHLMKYAPGRRHRNDVEVNAQENEGDRGRVSEAVAMLNSLDHWYYACTLDELKEMVKVRGIEANVSNVNNCDEWDLGRVLEATESLREFHRFQDLPVELRKYIYELYVDAFQNHQLYMPTSPPIARTSRRLRQESMQVLCDKCSFDIRMIETKANDKAGTILRMELQTMSFLSNLGMHFLPMIRNLRLCLQRDKPYSVPIERHLSFSRREMTTFSIHLPHKQAGLKVEAEACDGFWTQRPAPHPPEQMALFERAIRSVLKDMESRGSPDSISFRMNDIYALRDAIQGVYHISDDLET